MTEKLTWHGIEWVPDDPEQEAIPIVKAEALDHPVVKGLRSLGVNFGVIEEKDEHRN